MAKETTFLLLYLCIPVSKQQVMVLIQGMLVQYSKMSKTRIHQN